MFSRYPTQPVVPPTYQPNPTLFNPTNTVPATHFTPTPIMSNAQFVHGINDRLEMNNSFLFFKGNSAPMFPPGSVPSATDLSNVPPVSSGPLMPSYQEAKPATAWNDPPTVLMRTPKTAPTKVSNFPSSIFIFLID